MAEPGAARAVAPLHERLTAPNCARLHRPGSMARALDPVLRARLQADSSRRTTPGWCVRAWRGVK
ncbi:hypothetical protein SALB1_3217 [Salinisphaera sp. LB1]|nr:hypothetical protein SALB1_3217 [Salinisphaera sp. LB1]